MTFVEPLGLASLLLIVFAGMSVTQTQSLEDHVEDAVRTRKVIAIVRVVAVERGKFTNKNPPQTTIEIERVLSGTLDSGLPKKALWRPVPLDPHGNGAGIQDADQKAWYAKKLPAPAVGSRHIISIWSWDDEIMILSEWVRADASTESVARVEKAIAATQP